MSNVRPTDPLDDTSAEIRRLQTERYRRMTPAERVALAMELEHLADTFALAGLRQRHPDADADELRFRLLALKHGAELIREAYGWSGDD